MRKVNLNKLVLRLQKAPIHSIRRTETISYPRSGHGALRNILSRYYGNEFHYCAPPPIHNCGCDKVPCTNRNSNYSKNHDFGLYDGKGIKIQPKQQYLIQFRNPIRSITSNYYLYIKHSPDQASLQGWYTFAQQEITYWNKLMDKWVFDSPYPENSIMCGYEAFISSPFKSVNDVVKFMSDEPINTYRLKRAIAIENIKPRDKLLNFDYFDNTFFQEIEAQTDFRLKSLGIPSYQDSV